MNLQKLILSSTFALSFVLPSVAQCPTLNGDPNGTPVSNNGGSQRVYRLVADHDMLVTDFEFYTRRLISTGPNRGGVTTHLFRDNNGMPRPTAARSGSADVRATTGRWYTANLTQPIQLSVGEVFYVGISQNNAVFSPQLDSGATTDVFNRPNSSAPWTAAATPAAGAFRVVCTNSNPVACPSLNPNASGVANLSGAVRRVYEFTATHDMVISDFEFFTRRLASAPGGSSGVETVLYRADANGDPLRTPEVSGIGTVPGFDEQWRSANLPSPVALSAGEKFFVGLGMSTSIYRPELTQGDTTTTYTRLSSGGAWSPIASERPAAFRFSCSLNGWTRNYGTGCQSGGGIPATISLTTPTTGEELRIRGRRMTPVAPVTLLIGVNDQSFGGLPLPFDLTAFFMSGCSIYTSGDLTVTALSTGQGRTTTNILLPNDPALVYSRVYFQHAVLDLGANPFGLAWSDGLEVTIGGAL